MAVVQVLRGNASGAVKAIEDLNKAVNKSEKEFKETTRGAKQLERAARSVAEQANPQQRYNRKIAETAELVRKGKVSLEDAQRVAQKYGATLERASGAGRRTFGSKALSSLGAYAAGVLSIGTAVQVVRNHFAQLEESAQAAADRVLASLDRVGELQQLADSPEKLAFARRLQAAGVAKDLGQASEIVFQAGSAGLTKSEREFLAFDVAGNKAVAPQNLADFAAKAKKSQTTLNLGTFEDATQKLIQTSEATDANVTQVAEATTSFGTELSALEFSGDAGLAALATINKSAQNIKVAGTRLRSFLVQVDKRGLKQETLEATVAEIDRREQAGETLFDILGEQKAVSGFRSLRNELDTFRAQRDLIRSAPERDILGERFSQFRKDPQFASGLEAEESAGTRSVTEESVFAVRENLLQSVRDQIVGRLIEERRFKTATLTQSAFDASDYLNDERNALLRESSNEDVRPSTRLEIFKFLRDTYEEEGRGPLTTERQADAAIERYDRMIELLEAQVEHTQKTADAVTNTGAGARVRSEPPE